jgi:hypothetical protein
MAPFIRVTQPNRELLINADRVALAELLPASGALKLLVDQGEDTTSRSRQRRPPVSGIQATQAQSPKENI